MRTLFILLLTLLIAGCRSSHHPVAVQSGTDTIRAAIVRHDSIFVRDSIHIAERGDTVFKTSYKYIFRDRLHIDTFYHHSTDTVTHIVETAAEFNFIQRIKMELGGVALFLLPMILVLFGLKRRLNNL